MWEQNYSNWRGDSEKRFKFDQKFFTSMAAWGVVPFTVYYFVASGERVRLCYCSDANRCDVAMKRAHRCELCSFVCICHQQRTRDAMDGFPDSFRQ